jgi:carotenoid 1,2-hydratase
VSTGGPGFDLDVPLDGYVWWYLDAVSDDGVHGLTLIAFLGSVFSPYYKWARRRGPTEPLRHCAMNVAIYGPGGRWAMTERSSAAVHRDANVLSIGPSSLSWDAHGLTVDIAEIAAPWPRRILGQVRLFPAAVETTRLSLDSQRRHRWRPIAPCARVEVALNTPGLAWSGSAYFDTNDGDRPLESDFVSWDWSRATVPGGTAIFYDVVRPDGALSHALRYDQAGGATEIASVPTAALPRTAWCLPRHVHCDAGQSPRVDRTFEDTPFYSRSTVTTHVVGNRTAAVHESLSLTRFRSPWVQAMLPFRMPRALRTR